MKKVVELSRKLVSENVDFVIVKIVRASGSSPRKEGAFMLVSRSGDICGTIGGGSLEKRCIEIAAECIDKREGLFKKFDLSKPNDGISMICGGDVDVLFTFFDSTKKNELDIYFKDMYKDGKVYIFGAGHVGCECVKVLGYLNFDVAVYDSREEFANIDRLPNASKVICKPYSEILQNVDITFDDYVVIMTHGHLSDTEVLSSVLKTDAKYIGCIGSKRKMENVNRELREMGFSDKDISRIHSPIGIDILSQTPEEIAISIASELIYVRNSRNNY